MAQWHIFNQKIQDEQRDHQNGADQEDPFYSAKKGRAHARIQTFEDVQPIFVVAERGLQLRTHFRKEQRV